LIEELYKLLKTANKGNEKACLQTKKCSVVSSFDTGEEAHYMKVKIKTCGNQQKGDLNMHPRQKSDFLNA